MDEPPDQRRGAGIRTRGLHVPNVARYQAALHPDWCSPMLSRGDGFFLSEWGSGFSVERGVVIVLGR